MGDGGTSISCRRVWGAGAGAQHTFLWQHNTMESLLERGEKLDDLVSKSEVLGAQSKAFYKTVGMEGHPLPEGAGDGWSVILGGSPPMDKPWGTALGARQGSPLLPQALGLERAPIPAAEAPSPSLGVSCTLQWVGGDAHPSSWHQLWPKGKEPQCHRPLCCAGLLRQERGCVGPRVVALGPTDPWRALQMVFLLFLGPKAEFLL